MLQVIDDLLKTRVGNCKNILKKIHVIPSLIACTESLSLHNNFSSIMLAILNIFGKVL